MTNEFIIKHKQVSLTAICEDNYCTYLFDLPSKWDGWEIIPNRLPYAEFLTLITGLTIPAIPKDILENFIELGKQLNVPIVISNIGLSVCIEDTSFIQYLLGTNILCISTKNPEIEAKLLKAAYTKRKDLNIVSLFQNVSFETIRDVFLTK